MSGTSMDGVDASLIETDGEDEVIIKESLNIPYRESLKRKLSDLISKKYNLQGTEIEITNFHAEAINQLMLKEQLNPKNIDLIGFHGHTIFHDPSNPF